MIFAALREMKPFSQLFFALFIIVACFLLFFALSFVIAIPIFGANAAFEAFNIRDLGNPQTIVVLKYFQIVQSLGVFILPPFVIGYLYQGNAPKYLHLNKAISLQSVVLIIALMFCATPFINWTGEINNRMSLPDYMSGIEQWMKNSEATAEEITNAFLNVKGLGGMLFNLFMIALLPAIGEELLFRGVIQKICTNLTQNHHAAIWISAILFSALHMQFYGFIPRMLLGAIFGYLLVWSGSIWVPIIGHFINNAFAVIMMYFINEGRLSEAYENIGSTSESYYIAIISLGTIILLLYLIKRQNIGNEIVIER